MSRVRTAWREKLSRAVKRDDGISSPERPPLSCAFAYRVGGIVTSPRRVSLSVGSFCSVHTWKGRGTFRPTKKSVFYRVQPGVTEAVERNDDEQSDAEDASDEDPCPGASSSDTYIQSLKPLDGASINLPPQPMCSMDSVKKETPVKFISFANASCLNETEPSKTNNQPLNTDILNDFFKTPNVKDAISSLPSNQGVKCEPEIAKTSSYYFTTENRLENQRKKQGSVATYLGLQTALLSNSDRVADRVAHGALERALAELKTESNNR